MLRNWVRFFDTMYLKHPISNLNLVVRLSLKIPWWSMYFLYPAKSCHTNTSTDHSSETLMWCDMFLFTCVKRHNKVRIMFSQSRSQMWCITISFGREGNIKGPHSTFGVDSWIFGVSRGCCIEQSKGISKLVEFTSTFQIFQTFTNLMIFCFGQTNSLSLSLWYKRQIV